MLMTMCLNAPAHLIFFGNLKTENQLMRSEVVSDWSVVRHPWKCD